MSITETLHEALRDFRAKQRDTPNWRPNRILLSSAAYEDYIHEKGLSRDDNPSLTLEKVAVVENDGQADPIILEKRKFYN